MTSYQQSFAWWSLNLEGVNPVHIIDGAARLGFSGIDFLPEKLWPAAKSAGLQLTVVDGHESIDVGFNDRSQHEDLIAQVHRNLDLAAANGVLNVTVAAGSRGGWSRKEGLDAFVDSVGSLVEHATSVGVGMLLEPLNTKVDHPLHECDTTGWAREAVDRVGSPALRILYDFYHAQIMEGDLLATFDANRDRIAHLHTAGVPGRQDLDDDQEVHYRGIARHLEKVGYDGFVAHEFHPKGDILTSLANAFEIFDVGDVDVGAGVPNRERAKRSHCDVVAS